MAWGTRLRHKFAADPLFRARLRMTLYYVAFCSLIFFLVSLFTDRMAHEVILEALTHPGTLTPEDVLQRIDTIRWGSRLVYVIALTLGTYVLMGIALRPVRDSIESERRFIASISHELRTPLTLAKAETEMLLKKSELLDLPRAIEGLKRNLEEIGNISRIIQFLLVLSDFSDRKTTAIRQDVRLADTISTVTGHAEHLLEEKGVTLETHLSAPAASVKGNPVALDKMLLNLVRNAITYSAPGDTVTIELLRSERGNPLLSVRDRGTGMSAYDSVHVFEPFYRGKNARPGGTGLGLSLVREVVQMHKARIQVKSVLGKGTEFTVEFPFSKS